LAYAAMYFLPNVSLAINKQTPGNIIT